MKHPGVYYCERSNEIYLYQWVLDENDVARWQVLHKDQDLSALYALELGLMDWIYLGKY